MSMLAPVARDRIARTKLPCQAEQGAELPDAINQTKNLVRLLLACPQSRLALSWL